MEDLEAPDPREERIAHLEERLRAAVARLSQAQEQFALARERLAQARRTLRTFQTREGPGEALETDRTEQAGDIP
jgi:hypothetical protein